MPFRHHFSGKTVFPKRDIRSQANRHRNIGTEIDVRSKICWPMAQIGLNLEVTVPESSLWAHVPDRRKMWNFASDSWFSEDLCNPAVMISEVSGSVIGSAVNCSLLEK